MGNCHTIQGPAPKRVQQFLRLIIFNDGERNAVLRTVAFETFAILTPLNNAYPHALESVKILIIVTVIIHPHIEGSINRTHGLIGK